MKTNCVTYSGSNRTIIFTPKKCFQSREKIKKSTHFYKINTFLALLKI